MVSFLCVAPPDLPVAPAIVAVRGELFGSLALVIFGLGTGTASGDTVRSGMPILGNGATGLLSCLPGRLGLWKDGGWNCEPGASEGAGAMVIFGDSGPCMGAVGATVFFSGCTGGGRRLALSWFRSLWRTDLVRSLLVSDRPSEDNDTDRQRRVGRLTISLSMSSRAALNASTEAGNLVVTRTLDWGLNALPSLLAFFNALPVWTSCGR